MRRAARTDASQVEIVKALRKIGAAVYVIGLPLDLLVSFRKRTLLIECKVDGGTYTKQQVEFMEAWPGEVHTVRTPEEAVAAVIGKEAMK